MEVAPGDPLYPIYTNLKSNRIWVAVAELEPFLVSTPSLYLHSSLVRYTCKISFINSGWREENFGDKVWLEGMRSVFSPILS